MFGVTLVYILLLDTVVFKTRQLSLPLPVSLREDTNKPSDSFTQCLCRDGILFGNRKYRLREDN